MPRGRGALLTSRWNGLLTVLPRQDAWRKTSHDRAAVRGVALILTVTSPEDVRDDGKMLPVTPEGRCERGSRTGRVLLFRTLTVALKLRETGEEARVRDPWRGSTVTPTWQGCERSLWTVSPVTPGRTR
jgi:hypothetical protein